MQNYITIIKIKIKIYNRGIITKFVNKNKLIFLCFKIQKSKNEM